VKGREAKIIFLLFDWGMEDEILMGRQREGSE
jgi:hypothetical protein